MKKTITLFYVILALAIIFSSCRQNGNESSEDSLSGISSSSISSSGSASSAISLISTISMISPTNTSTKAPTKVPTKAPTPTSTKAPTPTSTKASTPTPTMPVSSATSSNVQNNRVTIQSFTFNPSSLTVSAGSTVVWENQDSVSHNIVIGSFTSPTFGSGGTYSRIFNTAGTYNYSCGIHPYMTGAIIVN